MEEPLSFDQSQILLPPFASGRKRHDKKSNKVKKMLEKYGKSGKEGMANEKLKSTRLKQSKIYAVIFSFMKLPRAYYVSLVLSKQFRTVVIPKLYSRIGPLMRDFTLIPEHGNGFFPIQQPNESGGALFIEAVEIPTDQLNKIKTEL